MIIIHSSFVRRIKIAGIVALISGLMAATTAMIFDLSLVGKMHAPVKPAHVDQLRFLSLLQGGQGKVAFEKAFIQGDILFDSQLNSLDGIGANVGQGQRFTRLPRADLTGPGEWANHFPKRSTGPNAQACVECHSVPATDGAGSISANAIRDPEHSGDVRKMIQRNPPHIFGAGALQRVAEEMTEQLHALRANLGRSVQLSGMPATIDLLAKGVNFGRLSAVPGGNTAVFSTVAVEGINSDLVVRPFQWKGTVASLRDFNRGAMHNELGMQAIELVGEGVDGDGDGVVNEMTVGDITALTIYTAAQPRPMTKIEINQFGLLPAPLTITEVREIQHGQSVFNQIGCATCHLQTMTLLDPIFREPSNNPNYRDSRFPSGALARAAGVRADMPIQFDLSRDHPGNIFVIRNALVRLGALRRLVNAPGYAVDLYSDLKRHYMGTGLAESIDEAGTGAATWLTKPLWGVGMTAPYMHDGRATTLTEAILEHGGEAVVSADNFRRLATQDQLDLIMFLDNLTLIKGGLPVGF
ncbi:MAG: hypothetical protein EXS02_04995 [Planctomycetes bacterium]|nr:hypothetical protein [Planctomycetota bacterium]